jgi:hypothetical protein
MTMMAKSMSDKNGSEQLLDAAAEFMTKHTFSSQQRENVQFSLMSELLICEYLPPTMLWYNDKDYREFKRELRADIQSNRRRLREATTMMDDNLVLPSNTGIEHILSTQDIIAANLCKSLSIQAVLVEQSRQRILGYHDPDHLASLYESLTRESRERAHRRGTFHDLKFV